MNKLRLIKIYEFRGKIHPMEECMIEILSGLKEVSTGRYINYTKDNNVYFYQELGTDFFYIDYDKIRMVYQYKFRCDYDESHDIIKYLLEKHLNKKITMLNFYIGKRSKIEILDYYNVIIGYKIEKFIDRIIRFFISLK